MRHIEDHKLRILIPESVDIVNDTRVSAGRSRVICRCEMPTIPFTRLACALGSQCRSDVEPTHTKFELIEDTLGLGDDAFAAKGTGIAHTP